jgi:nucleoside-diphosphate-sugar epimerase
MTMPDAIEALLKIAAVPHDHLTKIAYNLMSFSATAEEICDVAMEAFPQAKIRWRTDPKRQRIVDSWPAEVNDSAARRDWGFAPRHDFRRAFDEYLIPTIRKTVHYVARG